MQQSNPFSLLRIRDVDQSTVRQSIWRQLRPTSQLFYSQKWNLFLLNSHQYIHILDKDNLKLDLHIRSSIQQLSYNDQLKIITYMLIDGNVVVYWMKTGSESVIKPSKEKTSPVLYFDWLYSMRGTLDFFIVEATGVRFFRVDEEKRVLKETKQVSMKITSCWFQCRTEVLACCNQAESGAIHIFHFNDKRSKNNYKGVSLVLDFDDNMETKQEGAVDFLIKKSKNANARETKFRVEGTPKNKHLFTKSANEQYHIQLVQLYQKTTLLFYNVMQGKLKIYTLLQDQIIKVNLNIKLPSDSLVAFCIYDNLLLAHLRFDKISFLFDTKRNTSQTVATPMPLRCPNVQSDTLYQSTFLDRWLVHPSRCIRKWVLDLQSVFTYLKQQSDLFLFLIRRKNSKMIILRWLRNNLFQFKVTTLSSFWKYMFDEYVSAVKLQDKRKIEQCISPTDVYANIFYTLQGDLQEQQRQRFADLIMESMRQMSQFRVEVPLKLQMMLCRFLLNGKRYLLLYQLVQLKVLEDTRDLALSLIGDSAVMVDGANVLQQLAIDILYRKELVKDLMETFAKWGLLSQLARMANKYGPKLDAQMLLSLIQHFPKDRRQAFGIFAKQFMRDYHPSVKQDYIDKELQNYA